MRLAISDQVLKEPSGFFVVHDMTARVWLVLFGVLAGGLGGCAGIGKLMGIGQPDALKGDIPLVISNPPRSNTNFGAGREYAICDFSLIAPDGTGEKNSWFGGVVAPPPAQGETREFRVKPGVYKVKVKACGGATEQDVQLKNGTRWYANGQATVEIRQATHIAVVAPAAGEPQQMPGYTNASVRTGRWITRHTCGYRGNYVCED